MLGAKISELLAVTSLWDNCKGCNLHKWRKNVVHWRGNPMASLLFIGEAPGFDEDEEGIPFIGMAGRTLDKIFLEATGAELNRIAIVMNMLGCRPPGNRPPRTEELAACKSKLEQQVEVVKPKVIVLLGATAAKLAGIQGISKWRGHPVEVPLGKGYLAIPTYHPSYLNRTGQNSEVRNAMIEDFREALKYVNEEKETS